VGRANLDGSNPQQSFITGAVRVEGIAVDAHHIYWSNLSTGIERANLDGTQVDQTAHLHPDSSLAQAPLSLNFRFTAGEARADESGHRDV
jgi:hypothetical protein